MARRPPEQRESTWADYARQAREYARWWREAGSPASRQARALARIASARAMSPWYTTHALSPDELIPLGAPLITREILQRYPGALIGDIDSLRAGYRGQTSGNTGQPVQVFMCARALTHYSMHLEWAMERAGEPIHDVDDLTILHFTVGTSAETSRERLPAWNQGELIRHDFPTGDPEAITKSLESWRPHILTTTPGGLEALLDALRGEDLPDRARAILTTTSALPGALADRVRERWNIPIIDSYGVAEIGPVAIRCPLARGEGKWHVPAGSAWVEETPLGIAITTLRNRAMPLTRYLTGDHIEGLEERDVCAHCGHVGQSFQALSGRGSVSLYDRGGERRSPLPLIREMMRECWGVAQFQLVVEEGGVATLNLQLTGDREVGKELVQASRDALPGFALRVVRAPPIQDARGKVSTLVRARREQP